MDDYISKPVTAEILRVKLEQWTKPSAAGNGLNGLNQPSRHPEAA
jgi:hypothetical protein